MEIDKNKIGKRIKTIRLRKDLTMSDFADLVGSGKSNVSRWERGINVPNDTTLKKIAELGNVSLDDLLYGSSVRTYIVDLVSSDEEFNLDDPVNKKALEDTISCFEDTSLSIEEMDVVTIFLQNRRYYKDDGGMRIHNKQAYTDYLELMNESLRTLLNSDSLKKQAKREYEDAKRFKGYEPPSVDALIKTYTAMYENIIQNNERLINKLK